MTSDGTFLGNYFYSSQIKNTPKFQVCREGKKPAIFKLDE
jgi:hypothetical protein